MGPRDHGWTCLETNASCRGALCPRCDPLLSRSRLLQPSSSSTCLIQCAPPTPPAPTGESSRGRRPTPAQGRRRRREETGWRGWK
eukprot:7905295-Pyramimonas_sp.AAC.1